MKVVVKSCSEVLIPNVTLKKFYKLIHKEQGQLSIKCTKILDLSPKLDLGPSFILITLVLECLKGTVCAKTLEGTE